MLFLRDQSTKTRNTSSQERKPRSSNNWEMRLMGKRAMSNLPQKKNIRHSNFWFYINQIRIAKQSNNKLKSSIFSKKNKIFKRSRKSLTVNDLRTRRGGRDALSHCRATTYVSLRKDRRSRSTHSPRELDSRSHQPHPPPLKDHRWTHHPSGPALDDATPNTVRPCTPNTKLVSLCTRLPELRSEDRPRSWGTKKSGCGNSCP